LEIVRFLPTQNRSVKKSSDCLPSTLPPTCPGLSGSQQTARTEIDAQPITGLEEPRREGNKRKPTKDTETPTCWPRERAAWPGSLTNRRLVMRAVVRPERNEENRRSGVDKPAVDEWTWP
jgi:hypothetical protein